MSLARSEFEKIPGLGARLDERWRRLGEAGACWTGAERVAMVREARAARDGEPPCGDLDRVATRAVRTVAAHPASIREHWVDSITSDGLDPASYVELVAVVSRTVAIDTVCESLGLYREPLHRLRGWVTRPNRPTRARVASKRGCRWLGEPVSPRPCHWSPPRTPSWSA